MRTRQLYAWRAAAAEHKLSELETDWGALQQMDEERKMDTMGGIEEIERELHASEGALLLAQEDLLAAQDEIMALRIKNGINPDPPSLIARPLGHFGWAQC